MKMKQNIKFIFFILLLLFSFMSLYMAHGLVEMNCHNGHEGFFKYALNNRESLTRSRKIIKKLKAIFNKVVKLSIVLSYVTAISITSFKLFILHISKASILYLFSFLCACFNAGKYKQFDNSSGLLPSMAV